MNTPEPGSGETRRDAAGTPEEAELLAFADRIEGVLRGDDRLPPLPPELHARLQHMTAEYQPSERPAWVFLVVFAVMVGGVWGAAVWTPLLLIGVAVVSVSVVAIERRVRRRAHLPANVQASRSTGTS